MIALAILIFFALLTLVFVIAVAGVIVIWLFGRDRHDPHTAAYGDAPFFPLGDASIEGVYGDMPFLSAGVARPEAGDPVLSPQPHGSPAAFPSAALTEDDCRRYRLLRLLHIAEREFERLGKATAPLIRPDRHNDLPERAA